MAQRLDFEIDVELETGLITGHAGVLGLIAGMVGARGGADHGPGSPFVSPGSQGIDNVAEACI